LTKIEKNQNLKFMKIGKKISKPYPKMEIQKSFSIHMILTIAHPSKESLVTEI